MSQEKLNIMEFIVPKEYFNKWIGYGIVIIGLLFIILLVLGEYILGI